VSGSPLITVISSPPPWPYGPENRTPWRGAIAIYPLAVAGLIATFLRRVNVAGGTALQQRLHQNSDGGIDDRQRRKGKAFLQGLFPG
jgi:hypothetical protein